MLLLNHLTLLPPSECFGFTFVFTQELLVHPYRPPATSAWLCACQHGSVLKLEEVIPGSQPAHLASSLQDHLSQDSSDSLDSPDRGLERLVFYPEHQGTIILRFALFPSIRILNSIISGSLQARAALSLYNLTISSWHVSMWSRRVLPSGLLDHQCQEVIIGALHKTPGLLVPCCVVPKQIMGKLKSPWRTRACEDRTSFSCLKVLSTLRDQEVFSRHPS